MTDKRYSLNELTRVANSILSARMAVFGQLQGHMDLYGGDRDIYKEAGYPKELNPEMLLNRYLRGDIATRVIDAPADETWRIPPELVDGENDKKGKTDTPFVKGWKSIAEGGTLTDDGDTVFGLYQYLHRADQLCGVGRFGILLLGLKDGQQDLSKPLRKGSAKGLDSLLYVATYGEPHVRIASFVKDLQSPRYGMPDTYEITTWTGEGEEKSTEIVHWTRCIHVTDNLGSDDVYGRPRLFNVWNRLIDLEKTMAASGEAAWQLVNRGMVFSTKDGYKLPDDKTEVEEEIAEFVNGLRKTLQLEGMDTTPLLGQIVDPQGLVKTIVSIISAATGIPQRILLGSERGELASSLDEKNWMRVIQARQQSKITPRLLRPLVNRLIWAGTLPEPSNGQYFFKWPNLLETDRSINADTGKAASEALSYIGADVDPDAFIAAYLPDLPAGSVKKKPEPVIPTATPSPSDKQGAPKPGDQQPQDTAKPTDQKPQDTAAKDTAKTADGAATKNKVTFIREFMPESL